MRQKKNLFYKLTSVLFTLMIGCFARPAIALEEFSLHDYGYGESVRLSGTNAESFVSIPVANGQTPVDMRFYLTPTPNIGDGFIALEHQGRLVASFAFNSKPQEVIFPLTNLPVEDGRLTVSLRAVMVSSDTDTCSALRARWIDISDIRVTVDGDAQKPATLKDFFPPTLRRLAIYVSPVPTAEELTAAFNLAGRTQHLLNGRAIDVRVAARTLDAPGIGPYERAVLITSSSSTIPRLTLVPASNGWPILALSAAPDHLNEAVETLFSSPVRELLLTKNSDTTFARTPFFPTTSYHLDLKELGYPLLRLQGSGETKTTIGFSQAALGGPVRNISLNLHGISSVLQKGGIGTLATFLNNHLVDSYALSEEGERFRRTIELPDEFLARDNKLDIIANYTPPGGNCRIGLHNMTLDIDATSFITATSSPIFTPLFDKFPQALLPVFDLFVEKNDERSWNAAARLITLWQRLSPRPLRPTVNWLHPDIDITKPSVLISSQPTLFPSLQRLIDPPSLTVAAPELSARMNMAGRFAVLETFLEKEYPVISLTTTFWPEGLSRLTDTLMAGEGWYDTTGNTLVVNQDNQFSYAEIKQLKSTPLKFGVWGSGEGLSARERFWYATIGISIAVTIIILAAVFGLTHRLRHSGAPRPSSSLPSAVRTRQSRRPSSGR